MQRPKEDQKGNYVDTAVIERKKKPLPGEVSTTTSWLGREVSRSHSTYGKRVEERSQKVSQVGKDRTLNYVVIRLGCLASLVLKQQE